MCERRRVTYRHLLMFLLPGNEIFSSSRFFAVLFVAVNRERCDHCQTHLEQMNHGSFSNARFHYSSGTLL